MVHIQESFLVSIYILFSLNSKADNEVISEHIPRLPSSPLTQPFIYVLPGSLSPLCCPAVGSA